MTEEQIIDVTSEEVVEEEQSVLSVEENPQPSYYDQYVDFKKQTYRFKQLKKQVQNNIKSQRGFGYTYKEIDYGS